MHNNYYVCRYEYGGVRVGKEPTPVCTSCWKFAVAILKRYEQVTLCKEAVEVLDVDVVASDEVISLVIDLRTITEVQVLSGFEHGPAPEGRRGSVF